MNSWSPLRLTITLSLATLLGYGAYRLLYTPQPETPAVHEAHAGLPDTAESGERALPDVLPAFALADLQDVMTPIDTWAGRPLVVNFWATWCAPCLREIPLLKQFQASHPDVQVIGIAVDRPGPVRQFAADAEFNYPILVGQPEAMDAASAFGIDVFVLPFTVFTSAAGATLGIHAGELHAEHLDDFSATLAELNGGALDLAGARARVAGLR